VIAAAALAREHAAGQRGPRAVSRAVREVSTAIGNTPAVARSSYIDPRVIDLFQDGVVIDLPEGPSVPAGPIRIEPSSDEVVIELPTDVDEDAIRLDIEHRVHELLVRARPARPVAA
jgi:hypothetical protein